MQNRKYSDDELKKRSIRLFIVAAFLIYLITPPGHAFFNSLVSDTLSLFTHHKPG